jgi:hypothetical protein
MESEIQFNEVFTKAVSFVFHTQCPLFLTGKAGTGKTTFLRYIREHCPKKMAITAPTGVAAINAGGTTLHSLFHLPFGTYLRDHPLRWDDDDRYIYNRQRLLSKVKFTADRRRLLQELELLIIDEVSMLRADMLDAIDDILKSIRRDMRPFGGVQFLLIGDLYQLPPVVKQQEWNLLKNSYNSPFFFESKAIAELQLVQLELKTIFRQKDSRFIDLLNAIRNNSCSDEQIRLLNSHYQPAGEKLKHGSFITFCSHNAQADQINQQELNRISGKSIVLDAKVQGDYAESAFPTESKLQVKVGAQVMFIRNDKGLDKRYYNGKIGIIEYISKDLNEISIRFPEEGTSIDVEREEWRNVKYDYDKAQDKIKEETLGTFSQFPIRLAWAVTIHKSQGLTFERAIIDAGAAFAPGQVYVALSRLKSLDGLFLRSPIQASNIFTNPQVVEFSQNTVPEEAMDALLDRAQRAYMMNLLVETFDWNDVSEKVKAIRTGLEKKNIEDKGPAGKALAALDVAAGMHQEVAVKFKNQLSAMVTDTSGADVVAIHDRTLKAVEWFVDKLMKQFIDPLELHIASWTKKKRTRKYVEELTDLAVVAHRKLHRLRKCSDLSHALSEDNSLSELLNRAGDFHQIGVEVQVAAPAKKQKGETKRISLALFQEGKSVAEIARERQLTQSTIVNHLIEFIGQGVSVSDLAPGAELDELIDYLAEHPEERSTDVKEHFNNRFSYVEINIARKVISQPQLSGSDR